MSLSNKVHKMTAILARQWIELNPRHTAKSFARALGVSVRTGKRYTENPELFPESRAVALLVEIERKEQTLESRREERRRQREAVRRETQALMGLDDSSLDLLAGGDGLRLAGGQDGDRRGSVPATGYRSEGSAR